MVVPSFLLTKYLDSMKKNHIFAFAMIKFSV